MKRIRQFNDTGTISTTDDVPVPPGAEREYTTLAVFVGADGVLRACERSVPLSPLTEQEVRDLLREIEADYKAVWAGKSRTFSLQPDRLADDEASRLYAQIEVLRRVLGEDPAELPSKETA